MSRLLQMKTPLPYALFERVGKLVEQNFHKIGGDRYFIETQNTQVPITFERWLFQRVFQFGNDAHWPVHPTSQVLGARHAVIGPESSPGWSAGNNIDARGGLYVGGYTQIAPNVSIQTSLTGEGEPREFSTKIGKYCLLAMNSQVHSGVTLGDFTIVGSNAVVTESYPSGYAILGGDPARKIGELDRCKCMPIRSEHEYLGYVPLSNGDKLRERWTNPDLFDLIPVDER